LHFDIRPAEPLTETQLENRDRFIHTAQVGLLLLENLHGHDVAMPLAQQHVPRIQKIFVGVVTTSHLLDRQLKNRWIQPLLFAQRWRRAVRFVLHAVAD
jgi:hypothetical protein